MIVLSIVNAPLQRFSISTIINFLFNHENYEKILKHWSGAISFVPLKFNYSFAFFEPNLLSNFSTSAFFTKNFDFCRKTPVGAAQQPSTGPHTNMDLSHKPRPRGSATTPKRAEREVLDRCGAKHDSCGISRVRAML